jgi:hypothetical protein
MSEIVSITPETKIGALREQFPKVAKIKLG